MYSIVRNYFRGGSQGVDTRARYWVIACGLTLEQAQAHCNDPETSSRTATGAKARRITREHGPWFDSYRET